MGMNGIGRRSRQQCHGCSVTPVGHGNQALYKTSMFPYVVRMLPLKHQMMLLECSKKALSSIIASQCCKTLCDF
jgi:hypothetical protein